MKFASLNSTTQLNNNSTNPPMSLAMGQSVLCFWPSNDCGTVSIVCFDVYRLFDGKKPKTGMISCSFR